MSQLKPSKNIPHCELHKTGSAYIQRKLQTNREPLLEHGVLDLGPNTFKKRFSELWRHLQCGRLDSKTPQRLTSETRNTLIELAGEHPETIHTIVLSFEAIFGKLSSGLHTRPSEKHRTRNTSQVCFAMPNRAPNAKSLVRKTTLSTLR